MVLDNLQLINGFTVVIYIHVLRESGDIGTNGGRPGQGLEEKFKLYFEQTRKFRTS